MFVVCPSCSRHVRENESSCPFCAKAIPAGLVPVPHGPHRRYVGKHATALTLSILAATAGCSGSTTDEPAADTGTPLDASTTDAGKDSFTLDTAVAEIGIPDTGTFDSASDVRDDGGSFPLYK